MASKKCVHWFAAFSLTFQSSNSLKTEERRRSRNGIYIIEVRWKNITTGKFVQTIGTGLNSALISHQTCPSLNIFAPCSSENHPQFNCFPPTQQKALGAESEGKMQRKHICWQSLTLFFFSLSSMQKKVRPAAGTGEISELTPDRHSRDTFQSSWG